MTGGRQGPGDLDRRCTVDRLLGELLDAPPEERPGRFAAIEDPALRAEVRAMLDSALEEDDFLRPGGALSPGLLREASDALEDASGRTLGPYRLVRPIGRGGMGVVYLAERADGRFEREVAVKVLRLDGPLADRRRFDREQQILAGLLHPGIARLYDGGVTDEGDPYFVMEHVAGEPIDRACEERGLGLRERLELVIEVCSAVESAHRHLVVHRDLKPSNILVDGDGNPRLLDFGIASIEDAARVGDPGAGAEPAGGPGAARSAETLAGPARLTLQYASPEQLRGERVTVASDVYQLGLLLYELVAGRPPHDLGGATLPEATSRIAERPDPPSEHASARLARGSGIPLGDLDAVAGKALAFETSERYPSAASLRDDLKRLLAGRPVSAVAGGAAYRARRLIGRHPVAVAAALAGIVLVTTLVSGFTWRLAKERDATREQAERAEESLRFVTDLFRQAGPERGSGPDTTARELLDLGARGIRDRLDDRPLLKARILSEIGAMYEVLGLWEEAESSLMEGLELRRRATLERLPAAGSGSTADGTGNGTGEIPPEALARLPAELSAQLADSWVKLGRLAKQRGRLERAAELLERALAAPSPPSRATVASALTTLGTVRTQQGRLEEAETLHRRALAIYEEAGDPQAVAGERVNLSSVLVRLGRRTEGRRLLEEALASLEPLRGPEHVTVAAASMNLATLEVRSGAPERAVPLLERAIAAFEAAYGPKHAKVGMARMNLGNVESHLGRHEDARRSLEAALEIYRALPGEHYTVGTILMNLGVVESRLERWPEAEAFYRRALVTLREHLPDESREVPLALYNLGESVRLQGRLEEAEALLTESRDLFAAALGEGHFLVSVPLLELGRLHAARGERAAAEAALRRVIEIRRAAEGVDPEQLEEATAAYEELTGTPAPDGLPGAS